jgi:hypothetical protein
MAGSGRRHADDRLAMQLAAGQTIQQAARSVHVSERTVHRRLADSQFQRLVTTLRGEMVNRATGRLSDDATKAVETLAALLSAKSEPVRLGAARSILELGAKLRESTELERRIADLEARTNGKPESPACTN